jgi:mono/diheme cytochrome c family protein
MDQEKRNPRTVVAILVLIGLAIVGLAVWTSNPIQEAMAPSEVAQETPPEAEGSTGDEAAPKADETAAADEEEAPTAEEEAAEAKKEEATAGKEEAAAEEETAGAKEEAAAAAEDVCCKPGDTTPPLELVKQVPPGGLHNPYDWKKLKEEHADNPDYLVKQFRLPGCNECHGGTGGGGFCPALTQGVWFWGNTDDVLFRLVSEGSAELKKQGFERYQYGTVKAPMPPMGHTIKTADHLWRIIAFIRSVQPPGANPPEKVVPGKYTPPSE